MTGETISHYRILERLGGGGMGIVYRAEDLRLGRHVAVKFLHAGAPEMVERFHREALAAAALNHPHICTVFDIGEFEQRPFLVMELLEGKTLEQTVREQRPTAIQFLEWAVQIADGLEAAHAVGIIHRDIKSANIFITHRSQAKILDFGLAKRGSDAVAQSSIEADTQVLPPTPLTSHGMTVGTVAYMSPEQALGDPVDPRADLFSFGVVLFEMATGDLPFKGPTPAALYDAILHSQPPCVLDINPNLPEEIESVIQKALEKDRERRAQSAAELKADLKRIFRSAGGSTGSSGSMDSATGPAHNSPARSSAPMLVTPPLITPPPSPSRRNLLWGGGAAAAVLATGVGGKLIYDAMNRTPPLPMHMVRLTSSGRVIVASLSPDRRFLVAVIDEGGRQSLKVRQIGSGVTAELQPADNVQYGYLCFSPDGEYLFFSRSAQGAPMSLFRTSVIGGGTRELISVVGNGSISISPDGVNIAFQRFLPARGESHVMLSNADGGNQRALATRKLPQFFNGSAWSSDGQSLACSTNAFDKGLNASIVVLTLQGRAERTLIAKRWKNIFGLTWLPDRSGVVAVASEGPSASTNQIWLVSYPEGRVKPITNDANNYAGVSVSADGHSLATVQFETRASLEIFENGVARSLSDSGRADGIDGVSWHRDDEILYITHQGSSTELILAGSDGGSPHAVAPGAGSGIGTPLAPRSAAVTGEIVFAASAAKGGRIWRTGSRGDDPREVPFSESGTLPEISPDGKTIFFVKFSQGIARIWKMRDGKPAEQVANLFATYPAISPDGKLLAFVMTGGSQEWRIGFMPSDGGQPRFLDHTFRRFKLVRWRDSRTLTYYNTVNGATNIFAQDIDGGTPQQITSFTGRDRIFSFDWSPNGKKLLCSRGTVDGDAVLINNF